MPEIMSPPVDKKKKKNPFNFMALVKKLQAKARANKKILKDIDNPGGKKK